VTAPRKARRDYGPVQLADHLGLARWQLDRALAGGLIPGPDRPRGRWSAAVADAALAGIDAIRAAAGTIPDLGAVRAAEVLSGRLGFAMTADGVEELARRGLLPVTGSCTDHAVYDGRALEAFTDHLAAGSAAWAGQLRTAGQAAAYLKVRRWRPGSPDPPRHTAAGQARARALRPARPASRCTGPGTWTPWLPARTSTGPPSAPPHRGTDPR